MSTRRRVRGPVYRAALKDRDGFPTMVVAGPQPRRSWLYVHGPTPTVLRLHRPVVRFLQDALTDLARWWDRPEPGRPVLTWVLPWDSDYPECVLIAAGRRVEMHVFASTPSVVRLNTRAVAFLRDAVSELPATTTRTARRAIGDWTHSDPTGRADLISMGVAR